MFVSRAGTRATSDYDGDDNNGGDNNTHAHTRSSQTKDQRLLQRCAMQCARKCGLERIRARSLDWGPHSQAPQTHSHIYTCTLATHTRTHTLTHTFACGGTIVSTNRATRQRGATSVCSYANCAFCKCILWSILYCKSL